MTQRTSLGLISDSLCCPCSVQSKFLRLESRNHTQSLTCVEAKSGEHFDSEVMLTAN